MAYHAMVDSIAPCGRLATVSDHSPYGHHYVILLRPSKRISSTRDQLILAQVNTRLLRDYAFSTPLSGSQTGRRLKIALLGVRHCSPRTNSLSLCTHVVLDKGTDAHYSESKLPNSASFINSLFFRQKYRATTELRHLVTSC
jgi:hypothetical protein